jgi:hypothetical protein
VHKNIFELLCTPGHEISGPNPVARSESLAAIFSHTDLTQKKKRPNAYRQTKIFGRQWQPGNRKFRALLYTVENINFIKLLGTKT